VNQEHRNRQRWLKFSVIACVGIVFLGFSFYIISDFVSIDNKTKKTYETSIDLPLDGIDPKEIWVDQIRSENEIVQGKVDFIQEMLVKRVQEDGERDYSTQNEIAALHHELNNLKSELKKNQPNQASLKDVLRDELREVSNQYQQDGWDPYVNPQQSPFQKEMFTPLSSIICPEPTNLHHVDRTIPTGTSVKAILVSSVDMPCGVKGSSDPLPVKLRLITDGHLPHNVRARLKSGIVTASVYGDLSSERVYFRLEKLTQLRADGNFIETQIAGYVSGEDGKYGLRGTVVDKSSQLIENALLTGFLSGASNFFESAATARLYPQGTCNNTGNNSQPGFGQYAGQLAIAGGSNGVTNALDALTEYFINRAEQLRPVIQITPGRIVDITFLDCADLGDIYTHERVRNSGKTEEICGS
jgi:conjugal transfer pilus assembly protein TraB